MSVRLLFAAGGTGGHIFPAIAVADACRRLNADTTVEFVGTRGRMEEKVVPRAGYPLNFLWISGLDRRLSTANLLLPAKFGVSLSQAWRLFGRLRPDIVICAGAYVSLPVGLAASMRGIPLVLMESNAYPGLAVRKLASRAIQIHVAFDEAAQHFPGRNVINSGNPVRNVFTIPIVRAQASQHFRLRSDLPTLFAFGGSLGAASINRALDSALPELLRQGVQVIWQTGTSYQGGDLQSDGIYRTTFLNDMEYGYAASDLVLARGGATTISELRVVGRPSILVPLPIVAVRQLENAMAMKNAGASEVIADNDIEKRLLPTVVDLINNRDALRVMGQRAGALAIPDADERIAHSILALAFERQGIRRKNART